MTGKVLMHINKVLMNINTLSYNALSQFCAYTLNRLKIWIAENFSVKSLKRYLIMPSLCKNAKISLVNVLWQ